jgi:hypothetical protein
MEFMDEASMEHPDYSVPQPENQIFYSQVGQVADKINQCETYAMRNIHVNWTTMVSISGSVALLVNRIVLKPIVG